MSDQGLPESAGNSGSVPCSLSESTAYQWAAQSLRGVSAPPEELQAASDRIASALLAATKRERDRCLGAAWLHKGKFISDASCKAFIGAVNS